MGPDEFATREEVGLMVRLLFAKISQQAAIITELEELLLNKEVITKEELAEMSQHLANSPHSKRASEYVEKLREYTAIHQIVRQYLDPPEE